MKSNKILKQILIIEHIDEVPQIVLSQREDLVRNVLSTSSKPLADLLLWPPLQLLAYYFHPLLCNFVKVSKVANWKLVSSFQPRYFCSRICVLCPS